MHLPRSRRAIRWLGTALTAACVTAALAAAAVAHFPASAAAGSALPAEQAPAALRDVHALILVWASGTPAVQGVAARTCAQLGLTPAQCASVSGAVRGAWLDLDAHDPAGLGRVGAATNLAGRAQALQSLMGALDAVTHGRAADLLAATDVAAAQISQPQWVVANVLGPGRTLPAGTVLVWATSYQQSSLPGGLNSKRSPYAALPDAYIKYANWGNISAIPAIYQPYYAPTGGTAHWTVNIGTPGGTRNVANVLVTDVGPWNEDDNWWDANGSGTTLPAGCPVAAATSQVAPDATSNALVDGICPNGQNLRRIYYYLLYQHDGLPFFQSAGYSPTGGFADGSRGAWPTALPQQCTESAGASKNSDGISCAGGTGYNQSNGGWLRNGTYDGPIVNQSAIDVSPAVDKALGWTYPSSGLVQVYVGALP